VSTAAIGRDLHQTLQDTDKTVVALYGSVGDIRATVQNLNITLIHVQGVVADLQKTTTEERAYWNKTAKESSDAARDLRALLARTDRSLNDHLLPDLDREVNATAAAAQTGMESIAHSADTLTFQLNDPAIAQMAEHLNVASASVAGAAQNTADATAHLDKATADIETAVHRMTKPPSVLKQIGMGLLDIASKLGSVFAGFVK
jgi:ABC-type transporter Mla subunit MlaD